jgi:hypothetical protein
LLRRPKSLKCWGCGAELDLEFNVTKSGDVEAETAAREAKRAARAKRANAKKTTAKKSTARKKPAARTKATRKKGAAKEDVRTKPTTVAVTSAEAPEA